MDRRRNITGPASGAAAALATGALALAAAAPPAMASNGRQAGASASAAAAWKIVYRHHYGVHASENGFRIAVAPSQRQAWAFGGSDNFTGHAIAARWTGGRWRNAALPAGLASEIDAASASSPSNVWAVVQLGQVVLHWNGHRWSVAKRWHISGQLTGVTALSPTDVWVFGSGGFTGGLGTWHYNGKTWKHLTRGAASGIAMASAVSSSNMWGIGSEAAPQESIVHYSHGRWQRQSAAALAHHQFNAILALSATSVWAIASPATNQTTTSLLHFNGHKWSRVRVPGPAAQVRFLEAVDADGHGGFWLITPSSILHRTAAGRWARTQPNTPHGLSLVHVPGTSTVLAPTATAQPGSSVGSDAAVFQTKGLG